MRTGLCYFFFEFIRADLQERKVGLGVFVALLPDPEPEPEPDPDPLPESVVVAVVVVVVASPSGDMITSPCSVVTVGSVSDSVVVVVASAVVVVVVESVGTRFSFLLQPRAMSAIAKTRTRTPATIESVIVNCFLSMSE